MAPVNLSFNETQMTALTELINIQLAKNGTFNRVCSKSTIMATLTRPQVEAIYWCMVILIMLLVMGAAVVYSCTEKEFR